MYSTRHPGVGTANRAASALVGLVLLFGIVIAGAGIIFWAGMDAKQSVQSASEVDTAETSLQAVSSKLSTLSFKGDGAVATFDLSGKDTSEIEIVDDGEMRFQLNGKSACTATIELGSIQYENDNGATVAYQGGAVFKKVDGGVAIVQSPELAYRTKTVDGRNVRTIQFPVTNVSGDVDSTGSVTARANKKNDGKFQEDLCLAGANTNEIDYVREIEITVEGSTYYEGWARFFEEEFPGGTSVVVDEANEKVTVTAPLGSGVHPDQFTIDDEEIYGAIFSGSSSGELLLQTQHATVDSYDSANGPWGGPEPTYGDDGNIITRGSVKVHANGAQVRGNVYAEGEIDLSNSCAAGGSYCIDGDAYVNNSTTTGPPTTSLFPSTTSQREDAISGSWGNGTIVPEIPTMDAEIAETLATVNEYNDNDAVSVVHDDEIQYSSGTATVESGVYSLDEFDVPDGNTLTLDTTSGDVVFAVDGDVEIGDDATVEVVGPGQVRTFIGENTESSDQLTVGRKATVKTTESSTRTYRSNAFFLACNAGCSATFEQGTGGQSTEFTGVLYGPGEAADDGTVDLNKHVEVWGALVSGTVTFEQRSTFHFDTDLKNSELDSDGDGTPDVVDDDDSFPDGDGDGFSESEDECPNVAGTGENGCAGVSEDEDDNTLVVNQTSATITVLGSQIANEETIEVESETRLPLNVELVIDDSGSMMRAAENAGNPYQTKSWGAWSNWEKVSQADYIDGDESPDEGASWEVEYDKWVCQNWEYYPGWGWYCTDQEKETVNEIIESHEDLPDEVGNDDEIRRRFQSDDSVTVPSGKVYYGHDDTYGIASGESYEVYMPGETIEHSEWEYYYAYDLGNDPHYERLSAAKSFVDEMKSKDRLGLVRFDGDVYRMNDLTNDFDDVDDSLAQSNWESFGSTNIAESLDEATENLESSPDTRDGMDTRKTIVLLTDGEHTESIGDVDGDGYAEQYWKEVQGVAENAHDEDVRIYTVALGDGSNTNQSLLKDIANTGNPVTDGAFYHVENANELSEKFEAIADDTKKTTKKIIQHSNTSTQIHMGGNAVSFDGNTNPYDGSYPSKTVDANLDPGDAVHFTSTTYQCDGNTTFDTTTNPSTGESYDEAYCTNNDGIDEQTSNSDHANHQIFTDGDSIPTVETTAWYKDSSTNSLKKIVENYDSSLVDGSTFDLPENDAIILVEIEDGEPNDRDFMVLYFDANDQDPPAPEDQDVDLPEDDDDTDPSDTDGTANDYVIDVDSNNVNVSAGDESIRPITPRLAAADPPSTPHKRSMSSQRSSKRRWDSRPH